MKIIVRKSKFNINPDQFLRRAGYAFLRGRTGSDSYGRRLSGGNYPRLHLYLEEDSDSITFNLHLDQQKETISFNNSRHKGEYGGEIVEEEVARLKGLIIEMVRGNFFA